MTKKKITKGRPAYLPTDKDRDQVKHLSAIGIPQDEIAVLIGVSKPTLRKHFRKEIDDGFLGAKVAVAKRIFDQAVDKKKPNIAAGIFIMKARFGWTDKAPPPAELGKKEMAQAQAEATQEKSIYGTLDSKLKRIK